MRTSSLEIVQVMAVFESCFLSFLYACWHLEDLWFDFNNACWHLEIFSSFLNPKIFSPRSLKFYMSLNQNSNLVSEHESERYSKLTKERVFLKGCREYKWRLGTDISIYMLMPAPTCCVCYKSGSDLLDTDDSAC